MIEDVGFAVFRAMTIDIMIFAVIDVGLRTFKEKVIELDQNCLVLYNPTWIGEYCIKHR